MKMAGSTTTCRAKKRCTVNSLTSGPPRSMLAMMWPIHGMATGICKPDLGGEVAELIHGQQVAGEAEDRRQSQQRHAAEPAKLARLAVGLHKEDREHVHQDGEDHEVGRPGVRRTDQPAKVHHKGDLADRFVGFRARPVVNQQQHAGKALDKEKEQRDAAPVVPEGLGVDRDGLVARESGQFRETQPLINPVINVSLFLQSCLFPLNRCSFPCPAPGVDLPAEPSAVDDQHVSLDIVAGVGGQQHRGAGKVGGQPPAAHREFCSRIACGAHRIGAQSRRVVGGHVAGRDGVDVDALVGPLIGQEPWSVAPRRPWPRHIPAPGCRPETTAARRC